MLGCNEYLVSHQLRLDDKQVHFVKYKNLKLDFLVTLRGKYYLCCFNLLVYIFKMSVFLSGKPRPCVLHGTFGIFVLLSCLFCIMFCRPGGGLGGGSWRTLL